MKKLLHLTLSLLFCGLSLLYNTMASAQTRPADNPLFRHLPPDAEQIYHINFGVIAAKFDWQGFVNSIPDGNAKDQTIKSVIGDPLKAGVDTHRDIFIAQTNLLSPDSPSYTTILLPLVDSGKFVRFFKKENKDVSFVILPGKIRTAKEGTQAGYAWNNKLAVVTLVKGPRLYTTKTNYVQRAVKKSVAALKGFDDSPYLTDELFRKGFTDDADVHTWSMHGAGMNMLMQGLTLSPVPIPLMSRANALQLTRARTVSSIRFDNGRIIIRDWSMLKPEDAEMMAKFDTRPLNEDLLAHLPQGHLLGIAALHFDPAAILPVLDKYKVRQKVDSLLLPKGLTTEEVLKAFKGDILVAVIGKDTTVSAPPASDTTSGAPAPTIQPNVYIIVTIGDRPSFTKLASSLDLLKDGIHVKAPAAADSAAAVVVDSAAPGLSDSVPMMAVPSAHKKWNPAYTLRNNILVIGSDKQKTDDFFDKPGRGTSSLVTEDIRTSPFGMAIDIKEIVAFLQQINAPLADKKDIRLLSLFDKVIYTVGKVHDGQTEAYIEVKMKDQQRNSLDILKQLIGQH